MEYNSAAEGAWFVGLCVRFGEKNMKDKNFSLAKKKKNALLESDFPRIQVVICADFSESMRISFLN